MKLDSGNQLVNVYTRKCLNIEWSETDQEYNLALADCYKLPWGQWKIDTDNRIHNIQLGLCVSLTGSGQLVLTRDCMDAISWSTVGIYAAGEFLFFQ